MRTIMPRENVGENWKLPLLPDYIKKWTEFTPDNIALISADTGKSYTYQEFDEIITLYAMRLKEMGLGKGDVVVAQWLAFPEFFFLTYACATIGAIMTPLDVKLQVEEVLRDMNRIDPVAFFALGETPMRDFSEVSRAVKANVASVRHIVEFGMGGDHAIPFGTLFSPDALEKIKDNEQLFEQVADAYVDLSKRDPHIIIFTTGTTGLPKPALICHENTIINNAVYAREVGLYGPNCRPLNSMPTSHVAGTCQGPMTTWFAGGTVVTANMYTPQLTVQFIEKYRPTIWGGVPTMFRMVWALPEYEKYDLSSLRIVLYGGSAVDKPFLEKMATMSPTFGTSLGMTECAGYFTGTPKGAPIDEMFGQVGQVFPDLAPVTIRQPMNEDGTAGEEVPSGEVGDICVHGPIVFLGYYHDPEATARMITREGILYTGDMGYFEDFGSYQGLKFAGRRKFVIKPKGYLVFPEEVSFFISTHPKVNQAQIVGVHHDIYVDGVFAFVQPNPGVELSKDEIFKFCKSIASYKRPIHVELWPSDVPLPANRVGKLDVPEMTRLATEVVERLRQEGKWDKSNL